MYTQTSSQQGFTLVEMMVAVAMFTIIVFSGISGLIAMQGSYRFIKKERSALDSLSFVAESMSRDIRTGTHYNCGSTGDCYPGGAQSFSFIDQDNCEVSYDLQDDRIVRTVLCGSMLREQFMTDVRSIPVTNLRFYVNGTSQDQNDALQPLVSFVIQSAIQDKDGLFDVSLQTSVSQRALDIPLGL